MELPPNGGTPPGFPRSGLSFAAVEGSVELTAARVSPAVPARVAAAGANHAPAALGALDGVFPVVEQRRLAGGRPVDRRLRRGRGAALRVARGQSGSHLRREDPGCLLLFRGQELLAEPAEDVVDD